MDSPKNIMSDISTISFQKNYLNSTESLKSTTQYHHHITTRAMDMWKLA